jgi:hypothetical protein
MKKSLATELTSLQRAGPAVPALDSRPHEA